VVTGETYREQEEIKTREKAGKIKNERKMKKERKKEKERSRHYGNELGGVYRPHCRS